MSGKKIKNQSSLFLDRAFFVYTFKATLKNWTIYLSFLIYIAIIFSSLILIPLITNNSPINMFYNPIVLAFLIFCNSVVSVMLAIEIFRTPIDDGTELLIVIKPLSRIEITIVKIVVFFLFDLFNAFVAFVITCFVFAFNNTTVNNGLLMIFGILSGTILTGLIFGGFTILFSMFTKKIVAILTTIGISLFLTCFNVIASIFGASPISEMEHKERRLRYTDLIVKNNNVNDNNKAKVVSGTIATTNGGEELRDSNSLDVYDELAYFSNWDWISYMNFSSQLSSIYLLNKAPNYPFRQFETNDMFINATKTNFKQFDIDDNSLYWFYFGMPKSFSNKNQEISILNGQKFMMYANREYLKNFLVDFNGKVISKSYNFDFELIQSKDWNSNLFNKIWDKFGLKVKQELNKQYIVYMNPTLPQHLRTTPSQPLWILISLIAKDFKLSTNNYQEFFEYLDQIYLSGIASFVETQKINIFNFIDLFNVDKSIPNIIADNSNIKVKNIFADYKYLDLNTKQEINNFFGLEIDENTFLANIQNAFNKTQNVSYFKNMLKDRLKVLTMLNMVGFEDNIKLTIENPNLINNLQTRYISVVDYNQLLLGNKNKNNLLWLQPKVNFDLYKGYSSFMEVESVSLYETSTLYILWLLIGIIPFSIGIYLYTRRDFY